MRIAVVGGGINGLCAAWMLAEAGHTVRLYERGTLLGETSSASSKLLHGGIRYLENFEFSLVRESLQQRAWWLKNAPQHAFPLKLLLPVYRTSRRPAWKVRLGLSLYDWLAGVNNIHRHCTLPVEQAVDLKRDGMQKLYAFYDARMDEAGLGGWVSERVKAAGVDVVENCEVLHVGSDGVLEHVSGCEEYDRIVNVAGPWVKKLNNTSQIESELDLDLIRGSHIVLDRHVGHGYLLEVPGERRVFFVLPFEGKSLVGTTEVRQKIDEPVECSVEERDYLLKAYNHYFEHQADLTDVVSDFAGLRPLIRSASDPGKATREYALETSGRVISVFGGKWTTARALGAKIVKEVDVGFH